MTRSMTRATRASHKHEACDSESTESDGEVTPDFTAAIATANATATTIPRTTRRARPATQRVTRASYNYAEWKRELDRRPQAPAIGIYCTDADPFYSDSTESD